MLRGSPTPPGYRPQKSSPTVKVNSVVQTTIGQVELDTALANNILSLQSDVATKDAEIATKTTEITTLTSDLATANASLTTAQSNLATANLTIIDLQDQLANASGGTIDPYLTDLSNTSEWTFFPGQTSGASAQPEADFLDSYTYDAQTKVHSFTTKSIAVANEAYAINNGAEFVGPMWYQEAKYADGTPVMIGDSFSFTVRMEDVVTDGTVNKYIYALDIFEWPFINDAFDKFKLAYQRPVGFCAVAGGGTTKGFGTHANNNSTVVNTSANAQLIEAVGTVVTPGGAQNSSRPSWSIYWSGNYNVRNATTTSVYHTASTNTGPLYLGLFVSSNGLTTTVGGTTSMKISYSIGKLK